MRLLCNLAELVVYNENLMQECNMNKSILFSVVITLLLVFAVHAFWLHGETSDPGATGEQHGLAGKDTLPDHELVALKSKIQALEAKLTETQLMLATAANTDIDHTQPMPDADFAEEESISVETLAEGPQAADQWMSEYEKQELEQRNAALLASGWNQAEIDELKSLEERAKLEQEMREFEALRAYYAENVAEALIESALSDPMQEYLSEQRYDEYLRASGRPTGYSVQDIVSGSVAETAGLRPGDSIVRLDGERVYNEYNYMQKLVTGDINDQVTIQIERNGQLIDITVPRRPLGINSSYQHLGY